MKIVSLNVARPRLVVYKGATINTGIFKQPVTGPVALRTLNLDGERQADLSVHGGPFKAVYGYPSEHYAFWRKELNDPDLSWGMFGENFTTEGLAEADLHISEQFEVGSAVVMVRQPRVPCYKLAAKFQRDDILERFLRSGRSGFYLSVEKEGVVTAGFLPTDRERRRCNHDFRNEQSICPGQVQPRPDPKGDQHRRSPTGLARLLCATTAETCRTRLATPLVAAKSIHAVQCACERHDS